MQLIHCALSSRSRTVALDKERVSTFLWPHRCNALINANGGVGGRPGTGGGFDSSHRPVVGTFDCFNGLSRNILLTFSCYCDNPQMPLGGEFEQKL